jgi:PASTA domain
VRSTDPVRRLALRLAVVLAGVAVLANLPSLAAGSQGRAVAYRGAPVHVSASAVIDVRALARRANTSARGRSVNPAPQPKVEPEANEQAEPNLFVRTPSLPAYPLSAGKSVSPEPSPSPSASFLGQPGGPQLGLTKPESPPDTSGAVGRDKLMVALNSNYVIQRKSDGANLSTVSITSFWSAVGARDPFDPHVLYDPYSDRWLVSAADDPLLATSTIYYGISDTADPQGSWHLYAIDADPTDATWADYPTIGFSRSTVAIGVNMFAIGGLTYVRGRVIALDYGALRAGAAGNPVDISVPGGFALQPAITNSPTEKTLYVVEHVESTAATYRLWSLDGKTLTLVGGAAKVNPLGVWTSPGPGNVLSQQIGPGIDPGDSRIGDAVFRNGHIYYAQTVGFPVGGLVGAVLHSAVQWVELDTSGDFVQGGRIEDVSANPWNGGHSYAFGTLAVNSREDVLVGFSEFQSGDFVDAGYAFRAGTDPPNTIRAPVIFKDGEGPYERRRTGRNRWGDYSSSQVDPSDDSSLWTLQEYASTPVGQGAGSGRWGVWWGRVGGGPPVVHRECLVPKLAGRSLAQARGVLKTSQCSVGSVKRMKSAPNRRGRVVRQRPAEGTTLDANFKIDLWLGKGR